MQTFFEVSTLEMWPDIMFTAMQHSDKIDEAKFDVDIKKPEE